MISATPETDAAIKDQAKWRQVFVSTTLDGVTYDGPVAALCRRLERERDEARRNLELRCDLYKVQEELLDVTRCQRDEARAELERHGWRLTS
jgi:hypothetical protein